jgi:hypothetical protein
LSTWEEYWKSQSGGLNSESHARSFQGAGSAREPGIRNPWSIRISSAWGHGFRGAAQQRDARERPLKKYRYNASLGRPGRRLDHRAHIRTRFDVP